MKILLDNATELVYDMNGNVFLLFGVEKGCSPCEDMAAGWVDISGGSVEGRFGGIQSLLTNVKSLLPIKGCFYRGVWYYWAELTFEKGGKSR